MWFHPYSSSGTADMLRSSSCPQESSRAHRVSRRPRRFHPAAWAQGAQRNSGPVDNNVPAHKVRRVRSSGRSKAHAAPDSSRLPGYVGSNRSNRLWWALHPAHNNGAYRSLDHSRLPDPPGSNPRRLPARSDSTHTPARYRTSPLRVGSNPGCNNTPISGLMGSRYYRTAPFLLGMVGGWGGIRIGFDRLAGILPAGARTKHPSYPEFRFLRRRPNSGQCSGSSHCLPDRQIRRRRQTCRRCSVL